MKKTYLSAALAILMWSSLATVSKLLLGSMSPYRMLFISAVFAAAASLIWSILAGRLRLLRQYRPTDYLRMITVGLLGNCFYNMLYYAGAAILPASQAFIINYLWPMMSVVFAVLWLGERLTLRKGIALALSFIGVFTVAGSDLLHFEAQTLWGVLLCAAAAVCYGAFTALNRRWNYDLLLTMTLSFAVTALINLPLALTGDAWELTLPQLGGLLWNGAGILSIANTLWNLALEKGNTAKISNLAYVTPFLSLVWVATILGETISPWSLLGLCIIVLGIIIQLKDKKDLS